MCFYVAQARKTVFFDLPDTHVCQRVQSSSMVEPNTLNHRSDPRRDYRIEPSYHLCIYRCCNRGSRTHPWTRMLRRLCVMDIIDRFDQIIVTVGGVSHTHPVFILPAHLNRAFSLAMSVGFEPTNRLTESLLSREVVLPFTHDTIVVMPAYLPL